MTFTPTFSLLLSATITVGAVTTSRSVEPAGHEIAAVGRYHLRQRTQRFFERSTPAGRDAQQGIYQSLPRPTNQSAKCQPTTA